MCNHQKDIALVQSHRCTIPAIVHHNVATIRKQGCGPPLPRPDETLDLVALKGIILTLQIICGGHKCKLSLQLAEEAACAANHSHLLVGLR